MKKKNIKNKIQNFLNQHKVFLISAHTSPEGDSLGAQLAFAIALENMGKICEIVNSERHSREYAFLPGINKIKTQPSLKKYDAAIILDCSDISRLGNTKKLLDKNIPILNIDHHISNTNFGNINLVDKNASSACEMLYLLFNRLKIKIDKDMAICLYVGILTDTGSFRYINTTSLTHHIASCLLKKNINAFQIYKNIYENLTFQELKIIAIALSCVKKDNSGKIFWTKIDQYLLKKYKTQVDLTDNILNMLRSIRGAEVCVLFRERFGKEKNIRVNFRSKGKIDVNKIAQHFGGGGHRTASGATLKKIILIEAEKKVIDFIKDTLSKLK